MASKVAAKKEVDPRELERELARRVKGEVRFDNGTRAVYATDLSIYRQVPIGVVIPRGEEDVIETIAVCRDRQVPILPRGCGTSLAGQTVNVAVVIDFSKYMNRILSLDPDRRVAVVEPGVINDQLRDAAEKYHLTFAPDPATHKYCTLGGMLGNNSCGVHSVMGGRTVDNTEELDIVTYDGLRMTVGRTSEGALASIARAGGRRGEIYSMLRALRDRYGDEVRSRYPKILRRVSGYNLDELLPENGFHVARALVGTEGTCAVILNATVRLLPSPPEHALLVLGYPDIFTAADDIPEIREFGPIGLEAIQQHILENLRRKGQKAPGAKRLPDGDSWLLAEFGGDSEGEAEERARRAQRHLQGRGRRLPLDTRVLLDCQAQKEVWEIRESSVGASRVPGVEDAWPAWEDAAVAPERLGGYLRGFYKLAGKYDYKWTIYGHFGDGCVHTRIAFDLKTAEGVRNFRSFMMEAADLVVQFGGSLSGEHGDGQARAELLPKMYGPRLVEAFREFKSIWDPQWKMNPGKVVDPYRLDENLRIGPDYRPKPVTTHFRFPDDQGSFAAATERCFGIGKCRTPQGETMCPSFHATREELHTTRGRAHILFEMLRGDVVKGWRDEDVKESLDLCLSCKGCKGDCPVSVDMATYKAEFLSHYWEGRVRPRHAYAMGWIYRWARLGSLAPRWVNLVTQTPGLSQLAKAAAGIAVERRIPPFAPQTFKGWFARRPARIAGGPAVILWPDTFNNYFFPHTAQAAVEALEQAGYQVKVPREDLCCGRPLYDYGMLEQAEPLLRRVLAVLRPAIQAGLPVVGMEPSCISVFRDELTNLMPQDEDAQRLRKQSFLLGEFLSRAETYQPPQLRGRALVHGHCHHKAVLDMEGEEALLRRMGLEVEMLDSGCCGMAGSFGYEAEKYEISRRIGERVLLPTVRSAPKDTLIVANGFSCREQIAEGTDRKALHLAEVIQMALREDSVGAIGIYPEEEYVEPAEPALPSAKAAAGAAGLLLAMGGLAYLARGVVSSRRTEAA